MASNSLSLSGRDKPASRLPWVLGGIAAVLGIGLIAYLELAPRPVAEERPLTPEAKDYVKNLKLSDVGMKAAMDYFSQKVVEVEGKIGNAGARPLEVVEIYCVFYDYRGQEILRSRVPIVSKKMGGLAPGETKPFRLPFDRIPTGWNQQMPKLVIAGVEFS